MIADKMNISPEELKSIFGGRMGWMPGRGGNRLLMMEKAKKWFPNRYGKWDAMIAGSEFVRSVRDYINSKPSDYPKSTSDQPWTVREVEQVLFMDGH
jgi:hypothetical protein